MIKQQRNLSGFFFRFRNKEKGKFENRTFEDLPSDYQDEMMEGRDIEWLKSLVKKLANTLREIGDEFDLHRE